MIREARRWALLATIVVPGKPPVKKNSQTIAKRGNGQRFILPNDDYLSWKPSAVWHMVAGWRRYGRKGPVGDKSERICLSMHFFMPGDSRPDLSNLYEAVQDALQDAGVLTNDYWVASHDGSTRQTCDRPQDARVEVDIYACVQ